MALSWPDNMTGRTARMITDQQKRREFLDVLVALRQIIRATDLHSKHVMKVCGLTVPQLVVLLAIEE